MCNLKELSKTKCKNKLRNRRKREDRAQVQQGLFDLFYPYIFAFYSRSWKITIRPSVWKFFNRPRTCAGKNELH